MPSVPILTIPEGAYDPSAYSQGRAAPSRTLTYLLRLTNGSAIVLVIAYILGLAVFKPMLETRAERRLDLLEMFRGKLRDCYLTLVGRISQIPVVAINKNGKLYADAITQTDDSYLDSSRYRSAEEREQELANEDKLSQLGLVRSLKGLSASLKNCHPYLMSEIPHYKTTNDVIKSLQTRSDAVFSASGLFSVERAKDKDDKNIDNKTEKTNERKKNIAVDTKNEIRGIKGLFMSGQA